MEWWFLGGLIPPYIIRKPGVAFLGEFIASHVETPHRQPLWPPLDLLWSCPRVACELIFAVTVYRKWDLKTMLLAGAAPTLPAIAMDYYLYQYLSLALPLQLGPMARLLRQWGNLGGVVANTWPMLWRAPAFWMYSRWQEDPAARRKAIQVETTRQE